MTTDVLVSYPLPNFNSDRWNDWWNALEISWRKHHGIMFRNNVSVKILVFQKKKKELPLREVRLILDGMINKVKMIKEESQIVSLKVLRIVVPQFKHNEVIISISSGRDTT